MLTYHGDRAVAYAHQWALSRNPRYLDFTGLGGDCTNFVSQCLYAGAGVMNYTPVYGWFYHTSWDRTASWTGVEYLYNFLVRTNGGPGPRAIVAAQQEMEQGDIVQLGDEDGRFYHTLLVSEVEPGGGLLVSTHSYDALNRPLDSYLAQVRRFLHITGVGVP